MKPEEKLEVALKLIKNLNSRIEVLNDCLYKAKKAEEYAYNMWKNSCDDYNRLAACVIGRIDIHAATT